MSDPVPSSAISDATTGGLSVIVITGGSTGQVLTLQANGTYAPATVSAGSGDVVGPSSSTDNALARFDSTTGKLLQNSVVTVGDTGNIAGLGTVACGAITTSGKFTGTNVEITGYASCGSASNMATACDHNFVSRVAGAMANSGAIIDVASNTGHTGRLQTWTRAGSVVADIGNTGGISTTGLMCCGVYTFATVPSASSNTGKFLRISDRAQKHAYSDGTNWRFFGDDAIIS